MTARDPFTIDMLAVIVAGATAAAILALDGTDRIVARLASAPAPAAPKPVTIAVCDLPTPPEQMVIVVDVRDRKVIGQCTPVAGRGSYAQRGPRP